MEVAYTSIPQQKFFDNKPFPLVLSPTVKSHAPSATLATDGRSNGTSDRVSAEPEGTAPESGFALSDAEAWVKNNKGWIESRLTEHGAILFRGFPLKTANDFNAIVEAFGYEELPYLGGAAPRTKVVGKVFTSNESPPDQLIPFHHEMAQVPEFPSKLFFFCEVAPGAGGETPILLSDALTKTVESKHPQFVHDLREKGLLYNRVLGEGDDPSSAIGRGWRSTFLTDDKLEAEKRAAKLGMKMEWREDGSVRTVSGPLAALRRDPEGGREAWFNSMVAAYTGWRDARNVARLAVTFGDGAALPGELVEDVAALMEDVCVAVPWRVGDVLLLDNRVVQHARRTFVPPRRILAALAK